MYSRKPWLRISLAMIIASITLKPVMAQERVLSFPEISIGKFTLSR